MSITKKHDWKKGEYAFCVKIITPEGTVLELDCPHVPKDAGDEATDTILKTLGFKVLEDGS